jgi:hypothetical protein
VNKDGPALGLTISDNGAGFAFIKKIRDDSIMSKADGVVVGARLVAINGTALNGARHFEVARMLKEIPIGEHLSPPLCDADVVATLVMECCVFALRRPLPMLHSFEHGLHIAGPLISTLPFDFF